MTFNRSVIALAKIERVPDNQLVTALINSSSAW